MMWAWGGVSARSVTRTTLRRRLREQYFWSYERRAWICDNILIPTDDEESIMDTGALETKRQRRIAPLRVGYNEMRDCYRKWVESSDPFKWWLSVVLAIGTRKTGIIHPDITFGAPTASDIVPDDNSSWIVQKGVLKDSAKRVTGQHGISKRWVLKPILFGDTNDAIIRRIASIRAHPDVKNAVERVGDSGDLEKRLAGLGVSNMRTIIESAIDMPVKQRAVYTQKSHLMRAIYAVMAYTLFKKDIHLDQATFVSDVLGHSGTGSVSAYTHIDVDWGDEVAHTTPEVYLVTNAPGTTGDFIKVAKAARRAKRTCMYLKTTSGETVSIDFNSKKRKLSVEQKRTTAAAIAKTLASAGIPVAPRRFRDLGYGCDTIYVKEVVKSHSLL
jgi:hypothetical protein